MFKVVSSAWCMHGVGTPLGRGAITNDPLPPTITFGIQKSRHKNSLNGQQHFKKLSDLNKSHHLKKPVLVFRVTQSIENTFPFSLKERQHDPVNIQEVYDRIISLFSFTPSHRLAF